MQVAEGYIARQLPISVIVIDFFHWVHQVMGQIAMSKGLGEKKVQGDWSFDRRCWPDPEQMVDRSKHNHCKKNDRPGDDGTLRSV